MKEATKPKAQRAHDIVKIGEGKIDVDEIILEYRNLKDAEKTTMTKIEKAGYAHRIEQAIVMLKRSAEMTGIRLAECWHLVQSEELWKVMDHDTFEAYIASLEFDRGYVYFLLRVYRFYFLEHKIPIDTLATMDSYKLDKIIKEIKKEPEKIDEWIGKAKALSRSDLVAEIMEPAGKGKGSANDPVDKAMITNFLGQYMQVRGDLPRPLRLELAYFWDCYEKIRTFGARKPAGAKNK